MKTKLARIATALLLIAGFAVAQDSYITSGQSAVETWSVLIATNSQTLTYAIAIDVGTANVAKVTFNIDSDQTATSASIVWTARANGLVVIS